MNDYRKDPETLACCVYMPAGQLIYKSQSDGTQRWKHAHI